MWQDLRQAQQNFQQSLSKVSSEWRDGDIENAGACLPLIYARPDMPRRKHRICFTRPVDHGEHGGNQQSTIRYNTLK